jgi:hypothetical protein
MCRGMQWLYICVCVWDLGGWKAQTIGGGRWRVNMVKENSWKGTTMYFYGEWSYRLIDQFSYRGGPGRLLPR